MINDKLVRDIIVLAFACRYDNRLIAMADAQAGQPVKADTLGAIADRILGAEEDLNELLNANLVPKPPYDLNHYLSAATGNFSAAPDDVFQSARSTVEEMESWAKSIGAWDEE